MTNDCSPSLQNIIGDYRKHRQVTAWQGTCADYIELLKTDPAPVMLAPARIYNMIMSKGTREIPHDRKLLEGTVEYLFFAKELFGIDEILHQIMEYFRAGAARTETGRRVLVLVGPPAGGKSTFVEELKKGLEAYSTSTPLYMIKDCPMYEEPLHLIPRGLRPELEAYIGGGVKIEGDICPHCRHKLLETKDGKGDFVYKEYVFRDDNCNLLVGSSGEIVTDRTGNEPDVHERDGVSYRKVENILWEKIPVVRFSISSRAKRGIGVFEPTDPKSQDIAELVGGEDIAVSSRLGRGHPLSFQLDGELEKASRGLMDFREIFRFDVKFLYTLFGVAQEQTIKVQGTPFPLVYIDTQIVAHINTEKFEEFRKKIEERALQSRMYTIYVPYNLKVSKEVQIYEKLIKRSKFSEIHRAPHALWVVAAAAVMSRYVKSGKCASQIKKMRYYDGQVPSEDAKEPLDERELLKEGQAPQEVTKKEGMFGIDPRISINAINIALSRNESRGCLTPIDTLQVMREIFGHHMNVTAEEQKAWDTLIYGSTESVKSEYQAIAKKEVNKAFLIAFASQAHALFENYIRQISAYCTKKKIKDPVTGEEKDPDEKLMRSIEEQVGTADSQKKTYREGILVQKATMSDFSFETYQPLQEAIEKKLLQDTKGMLTLAISPEGTLEDARAVQWRKDLIGSLKAKGYCEFCAEQLLQYVDRILNE